jgi:hypothetical protein
MLRSFTTNYEYDQFIFIALTNHYLTIINHAMIKNLQKPFGANPPGTTYCQFAKNNRLT